ncbi:retinol dehydrogenase 7-like [Gigantopelta aegis]|uniref:retinol dehydrogenase 7-like n=1 Tax=Gigantopelta aegis TaxID=1735272 RepID=UPI001B889D40|nr:retinol dehydrogenase 7-like [Gigantopelta aegis]
MEEVDLSDEMSYDNIIVYSVLYSSVTVVFAMAVLSKFLTNEFRFGFRSVLSLVVLFLGEPLCQFLVKGPGGVVTFALGCLFVYSILPASHLPVGNKAVLITGCDSGFGHALVQKLSSIGMVVFAGCLDSMGPGAVELRNKCTQNVHILQLDVTNKKDIAAVKEYVRGHVAEEGLWGIVNNSGVWYFAELEMTSEKVVQRVMDINLFGAINVTKSLLPLVRQAKGRIVNVSSLLGRIAMEGNGAYSMSKYALVAYTDTLRQEMKKWGVIVSIIEPTGFFTGNMSEQVIKSRKQEIWDTMDEESRETYGKDYLDNIYSHILNSTQRYPRDLTPVIRCMRSSLLSKRPRERYPCGTGADLMMNVYPLLPIWLADSVSSAIGILPKIYKPALLSNQQ